ncbi:MAG: ATP-dependent DNA helicase, partial [Ruminococcaceae bacterium]|nr:ATP-dependent DNA helicase [Oscillospiraceae bacterium]
AKAGNYMVYFPSYEYLNEVYDRFTARYPEVACVVQHPGMSYAEREAFLAAFKADEGHLRVGFCVLGGSFSEGVDLPGRRLIGSIIVGVGIPGLSNERNILRDYYDNKCDSGYDYAYTYPGMNRVLQAAGRVIRREEDRGVIVLMDCRYAEPLYRSLIPEHWSHIRYAGNAGELANIVDDFWNSPSEKKEK